MKSTLAAKLAACALISLACTPSGSLMFETNAPGSERSGVVSDVAVRGAYLDARVKGDRFDYRLLFSSDETCKQLLRPDASVTYTKTGNYGVVKSGDRSCTAVGVLSLEAWMETHFARDVAGGPERENVAFEVKYRDADLVFVRGTFRMAAKIGITGNWDLMAIVAASESCTTVVAEGSAYLEYLMSRKPAFELIVAAKRCAVLGFAEVDPDAS